MNFKRRCALTLACMTLIALTAVGASAETIQKGTFTLPAQTYWNDVLLQPGEYTFSLDRGISGAELVSLRSEGFTATLVVPAGAGETSGHDCLKLDDVNGTYVIRELDAGRSYRFGVSKAVRNLPLRGANPQPTTVPISSVAGL